MSWSMTFETNSAEDLRKHADAYATTLKDHHQAAQVSVAVDQAIVIAEALGAERYTASLSGHASAEQGPGDGLLVHVVRSAVQKPEKAA